MRAYKMDARQFIGGRMSPGFVLLRDYRLKKIVCL